MFKCTFGYPVSDIIILILISGIIYIIVYINFIYIYNYIYIIPDIRININLLIDLLNLLIPELLPRKDNIPNVCC